MDNFNANLKEVNAIETIIPKDEADWLAMRRQDVTSTEVAALFGCSPYLTQFELWHRKHDNLEPDFQMTDRVKWGTRLEASIARGVAEDNGWEIRRATEYLRDPHLRLGASFDYEIADPLMGLEIKNVDSLAFKDGWLIDGDDIQSPPHIEFQVQIQMHLKQWPRAILAALIGGNRVVLIKREPDQKVIEAIRSRVKEFWDSVAAGIPPNPDFQRDANFIRKLHNFSSPGKNIQADDRTKALVLSYKEAGFRESAAKKDKDAAKAEILTLCGDAEKIIGDGFSISLGMIGPCHVEYDREGYRDFRVFMKKEKK